MKSRVLSAFIIIGLLVVAAMGQSSGKVVKAKAEQDAYRVKLGATLQAGVVIDIDSGYHINSNRPLDKFLVGTTFKVEPQAGLSAGRVVYPKPKMQKFSFSEQPLSVYSGRAIIKLPARAAAKLPLGAQTLKAKLKYQACSNQACFPPKTIEVTIGIEVVDAKAKVAPANENIFGTSKTPKAPARKK